MSREERELLQRYGIPPAPERPSWRRVAREALSSPMQLVVWLVLAFGLWVAMLVASVLVLTLLFPGGHEFPEGLLFATSTGWLIVLAALALWLGLGWSRRLVGRGPPEGGDR